VKLEWTHLALTDRDRLFDYIEAEHPYAAVMLDERLLKQTQQLKRKCVRSILMQIRKPCREP
jgi:plasmid stabilization system protein ParE